MKIFYKQEIKSEEPIELDFSHPTLTEDIKKTRYALENAYAGFDNATDPELIDSYIYEVNALLKRHTYLMALAQKERVSVEKLSAKSPICTLVGEVFG